MKRTIIALLLAVLMLSPVAEWSGPLGFETELSFPVSAKNKSKKSQKAAKKKKAKEKKKKASEGTKKSTKKKTSSIPTVPQISTLTSTAVSKVQPLLTVTTPQGCQRVDYKVITVYFSRSLRIPMCVAYELTATRVTMADAPDAEKRRNYKFYADRNVPGSPDWGDYRGSGYTRGHMAPAMDMRWDKQAMTDCFLMTNMCPQIEELNNGPWRVLEENVHRWAKRDGSIWVYAGSIMAGSKLRIGPQGDIAVPGAFYKVLYAPSQNRAIAFIYDNAAGGANMSRHATTIAEVERRTGLTFFPKMGQATAKALKNQCDLSKWK